MIFNNNQNGGRVVVTTDGGAGSSGKGALNSYLADKYPFDLATNNWMSNAGHYTELDDGTRILVQHVPSAFIDPNIELYVNAGAGIDIEILFNEIKRIEDLGFNIRDRLTIHPNANVITQENKDYEKKTIKTGSTFKGCGAALAAKSMRLPEQRLAKDYDELAPFIKDRTQELNESVAKGMRVLIEGSQGMDLDINHSEYPYCTSRQTHPAQLVADAGLPCQAITNVIVNLRTNPIRISNVSAADGEHRYTGNYWDAAEISWQTVAERAGFASFDDFLALHRNAMMTSVTKKVRRIFEFPIERIRFINTMAGGLLPNSHLLYSLNFANFIDRTVRGAKTVEDVMTTKVREWLDNNLFKVIKPERLKWIRTGPRHSEIVEMN